MSLLIEIETFLIFPVLFVEGFIVPSASVAPASSAYVSSTAFHERRYLGMLLPFHNCVSVFVNEVYGMLAVLWVPVVPGWEVILQVHF